MIKALWPFLGLGLLLTMGAGCQSSKPVVSNTPVEFNEQFTKSQGETNSTSTASTAVKNNDSMYTFPGILGPEKIHNKLVTISTAKGDIVIKLYDDTAPKTVSNFVYLIENGFYNGLTFHRREEGFVIQGGDPRGNGTGGPGYKFEDELNDSHQYNRGTVAMANSGPNTNGSQFFIMLDDVPLPKLYSIFGEVVSGLEVVDEIAIGDKMTTVTVESAP